MANVAKIKLGHTYVMGDGRLVTCRQSRGKEALHMRWQHGNVDQKLAVADTF